MVWKKAFDAIKASLGLVDEAQWILTDSTQFDNLKPDASLQQLVIGLDFGTAFTKVVIGEQRVKYAVPFRAFTDGNNPFLLPSFLAVINDGGECFLGRSDNTTLAVDNMKMRLIERDFSDETKTYCAAYLALVLRYCRGWLLHTHRGTYKNRRLSWYINIGLPTDGYDDAYLVDTYSVIVRIAWAVSVLPGPITLSRIQAYLDMNYDDAPLPEPYKSRLLHLDFINTYPEFAVQLAGYVRSPKRQESLHMLVDVGAGTLDVTTFNVYKNKEGDDLYPIFAQEVRPFGVRYLINERLIGDGHEQYANISPFQNIPDDDEFASRFDLTIEQLHEVDRPFKKKVMTLIREIMKYTKERRYRQDKQWSNGVPTFLCGGGASARLYIDIFKQLEGSNPPYKILPTQLEIPDDLEAPGLSRMGYNRLSVAYGLSYDPFDIGEIRKKSMVDDDVDPKVSNIGKQTCPRCRGTGEPIGRCPECNGCGWI